MIKTTTEKAEATRYGWATAKLLVDNLRRKADGFSYRIRAAANLRDRYLIRIEVDGLLVGFVDGTVS